MGKFIIESIQYSGEIGKRSHNPIDVGGELVVFLAPGGQHHSIASHQSQGESAKQLARGHTFFKPLTPSQSSANLLHLRMEATKCGPVTVMIYLDVLMKFIG